MSEHGEQQDGRPTSGIARSMACGAKAAVEERERVHEVARRAEPGAARAALGKGGKAVHVPRAKRKRDTGRAF